MVKMKPMMPGPTPLTNKPAPRHMQMAKPKKRLTTEEEFDILKMVLDKILWLGFGIMALGFYELYKEIQSPFALMFAGAVILITFVVIIMREYEFVTH